MILPMTEAKNPRTVLTLFGTRPEIIKLAPVIRQLDLYPKRFRTVNVSSGQHTDLLAPFVWPRTGGAGRLLRIAS